MGTTGLGGVVIRGLGSVGSVGSKGRRASAARLGRSPAHGLGLAGAGSRRRRILPGRRHLPGRHLSSSVDRCGRPPSTPLPSPHHHQSEEGPPPRASVRAVQPAPQPAPLPLSTRTTRSRRSFAVALLQHDGGTGQALSFPPSLAAPRDRPAHPVLPAPRDGRYGQVLGDPVEVADGRTENDAPSDASREI